MNPVLNQWLHFGVFVVNFEHVSHLALVFLLLTLNKKIPTGLFHFLQHQEQTINYCFKFLLLKTIYGKVDLGPCQIAMIELSTHWKLLTIFAKSESATRGSAIWTLPVKENLFVKLKNILLSLGSRTFCQT